MTSPTQFSTESSTYPQMAYVTYTPLCPTAQAVQSWVESRFTQIEAHLYESSEAQQLNQQQLGAFYFRVNSRLENLSAENKSLKEDIKYLERIVERQGAQIAHISYNQQSIEEQQRYLLEKVQKAANKLKKSQQRSTSTPKFNISHHPGSHKSDFPLTALNPWAPAFIPNYSKK